jgi:hypothetical protein
MIDLNNGWTLDVDYSPEWLFFRLKSSIGNSTGEPAVAEAIAREAANVGIKRVILELDPGVMLYSYLVGQIVSLHKRFLLEGGVFRVCGLSSDNTAVLQTLRLADRLPNYPDREAAVMGRLP